MMRFDGRPILISGAGRGLGEGIARHLAGEGAVVGVADVNGQTARDVTKAIKDAGGDRRGSGTVSNDGAA